MGAGDWIAIYGALLATILAFIQVNQWRKSQELIAVRLQDEFDFSDANRINLTLTNVSQIPLYIDFVGIGLSFRPWLMPWKFKHGVICGLTLTAESPVKRRDAAGVMKPGEMWDLWLHEDDKAALNIGKIRSSGFGHRPFLNIDHSADNVGIQKVLKWKWSS
jgi:hypothetical protein